MLRRVVAMLVVASLVGAACSRTLPRIHGEVLDSRTGRPLADVSVAVAAYESKTGPDGVFTFTEIPEDAPIRLERPNWHPRTVKASERPMRVKLVPIPVQGKVTSALNGEGLLARLEGAINEPTGPDGSFTVYGVGPGDRLKVSARFHETLEAPIAANRTLEVTLKPARVDPESAFVPLEGYALSEMPRPLKDELAARLYEDPTIAKATPLLAGRSVRKDRENIAVAIAIALDPGLAALPATSEALFKRLARDARGRPETLTIGGTPVQLSRERGGLTGLAWMRYTAFFVVVGEDRPKLEELARVLMEATR